MGVCSVLCVVCVCNALDRESEREREREREGGREGGRERRRQARRQTDRQTEGLVGGMRMEEASMEEAERETTSLSPSLSSPPPLCSTLNRMD